jgi:hypothetical protein
MVVVPYIGGPGGAVNAPGPGTEEDASMRRRLSRSAALSVAGRGVRLIELLPGVARAKEQRDAHDRRRTTAKKDAMSTIPADSVLRLRRACGVQKPGRALRGLAVLVDQPAEPVSALSAVTLRVGREADRRSALGRSERERSVRTVAVVVRDVGA